MEAYERLEAEGETCRAFEAYKTYRDLGPKRTLKRTAVIFYGEQRWRGGLRTVETWSSRYRWPERAAQRDEFIDSIRQKAFQDHERELAEHAGRRERLLQEKAFEVRELALEQALIMLRYPLVEEVVRHEGEDGEQPIVLRPAGWTKNTIKSLYAIAVEGSMPEDSPDGLDREDIAPEELSRDELDVVLERLTKVRDA